jgi:acyl carrier protein
VELEAVERAVMQYPGVSGCVAELQQRDQELQPDRLVAYYAGLGAPDPQTLRRYLEDTVPTAMVPGLLVHRPTLPVTLNAKVDRGRLSAESNDADVLESAPSGQLTYDDSTTERLLVLWREILADEALGIDDVFMDHGGDSLSVMLLIDKVAEMFDYELPLIEVFDDLTVRRLGQLIELETQTSSAGHEDGQAEVGGSFLFDGRDR